MQIEMKYQLFHARILFFVFVNCLWLLLYNAVFDNKETIGTLILFFGGLFIIDRFIFPETGRFFFRKGNIPINRDELRFFLIRKEKIINRKDIVKIERNKYKTMGVVFLSVTVFYGKKKYRLYFEDVTEENEDDYNKLIDELLQ